MDLYFITNLVIFIHAHLFMPLYFNVEGPDHNWKGDGSNPFNGTKKNQPR